MLELRVDCSLIPGVNAPITVDALLSAIEPILGESRRMVTTLRINGVEEPAFREPAALARVLGPSDAVHVDSTAIAAVATGALDDALRYLPALASGARETAAALSAVDASNARSAIVELADGLALLVALVHSADVWGRHAGLAGGDWLGEDVMAIERAAGQLEAAAAADDWSAAARALQGELAPALEAWQSRLLAGRESLDALQLATTE